MSKSKKENEDLNEMYCQSIAKSIGEIIRFSLDEPFRKRCFDLFGVSCTADTRTEIYKKLMAMIKIKNVKRKRDIEDEIFTEVDPLDQLPSSSEVSEMINAEEDWLLISSRQFKECIKSKKPCFYFQQ